MKQTLREQANSMLIPADSAQLEGDLIIPIEAQGIVVFAHGSGSSRHSPRNRYVAQVLRSTGLATLLIDLLTAEEEEIDLRTRHFRFDIGLLSERLISVTQWLARHPPTCLLRVGYFGASTGAAAALVAAADQPAAVGAIVSRGGRTDLAGSAVSRVKAPTLLIVGGDDGPIIAMNETTLAQLRGKKRLEIVPNATHLFEEPGALEDVARLASQWFKQFLSPTQDTQTN